MVSTLQMLVTHSKLAFSFTFSHCSVTAPRSSRVELQLTHKHRHERTHTHAHNLSLTPTHTRAISNQSQWLLCSSLNGRPDLRYAELFPPSPNFQASRGKRVGEKWRDREHEIQLFLRKPWIHFILLPNLKGPGTTYSVMRQWVEEGSEACWENSLQHSLQLSGETVRMQSFWVITTLFLHVNTASTAAPSRITIANILHPSIITDIMCIKQT